MHNSKPSLDWIMTCHDSDFTSLPVTTSSVVGLRSSKALPKAKRAPKTIMVTAWCSATSLIHYSFLNPGETITSEKYAQQINEMHRKLQCLQPVLVNKNGSVLFHDNTQPQVAQPTLQKLNEWATKFCLICHIHLISRWPTTTSPSILTILCRKNASTTRKCFPRIAQILKHRLLCYRNKWTYFLSAKNVLIVTILILINKDVFGPNYNDLKFTVQNHYYVFIKLNS